MSYEGPRKRPRRKSEKARFGTAANWIFAVAGAAASAIAIYQFTSDRETVPTTGMEAHLVNVASQVRGDRVVVTWDVILRNGSDRPVRITNFCTNLVAGDDPQRTLNDMARFLSRCDIDGREDLEVAPWNAHRFTTREEFSASENPFSKSAALVFMQLKFIDQFNGRGFSWFAMDCKSYRRGQLTPFCNEEGRRDGNLRPGSPVEN